MPLSISQVECLTTQLEQAIEVINDIDYQSDSPTIKTAAYAAGWSKSTMQSAVLVLKREYHLDLIE